MLFSWWRRTWKKLVQIYISKVNFFLWQVMHIFKIWWCKIGWVSLKMKFATLEKLWNTSKFHQQHFIILQLWQGNWNQYFMTFDIGWPDWMEVIMLDTFVHKYLLENILWKMQVLHDWLDLKIRKNSNDVWILSSFLRCPYPILWV